MNYNQILNRGCPALLFLLNTLWSQAQLNESDTARFQLRLSTGGNFQKGNVDLLTIRSRIDFTYAPFKEFIIKSQNSSLFQSFSNIKADNDISSRNYFYFKPRKALYPFGIAYISTNFRRKIDNRFFAGAGMTWQVLNNNLSVIKISASAVYETTRFKSMNYNFSEYNGSDQINVWRGTLYIGGWTHLIKNSIRIYYDAYWQPAFNNHNNFRNQFDIGVDILIWKGFTCNAIYSFTHENLTAEDIKQDDQILTFGFAYHIKKNKN